MAKKLSKKAEVFVPEISEVIAPVVEEARDLEPAEGLYISGTEPIYSDEFAYEIKAGKGTFPAMSDQNVVDFVVATLGKVDKIIITKM